MYHIYKKIKKQKFVDVFDTESLLGVNLDLYKMKPYDYGHTWYEILTGSGTINGYMEVIYG